MLMKYSHSNEIERIKNQIKNRYNPLDIILFGSYAKRRIRRDSDIDLCIVLETTNKRKMMVDILSEIEYDSDLDIVIYTPQEWQKYKDNKASFAGIINRTGVSLIG